MWDLRSLVLSATCGLVCALSRNILNSGYLASRWVLHASWDTDYLPKQSVHSTVTTSRSPCTFHPLVLVTISGVPRNKCKPFSHVTPLLSFLCNWSLISYRQPLTTQSDHFSLTVGICFYFPSEQRVIAIFHSGFDLPFLNLCIYNPDSIDYPFNLRCQLVSMNVTGLDQMVAP